MERRALARISKGAKSLFRRAFDGAGGRIESGSRTEAMPSKVSPLPADPISAARGSLHLPKGLTSDRLHEMARADEDQIEAAQANSG